MEIRLTDNSKLQWRWINPDALAIELHRPTTLKDGHGYLFSGSVVLSGDELTAFLADIGKPQNAQEVRR